MVSSVLVTGSTGFIGRFLLDKLLESGFEVRATYRNIEPRFIETLDQLTTIQVGEINAQTNWTHALAGIDIVIHLAARAHVLKEELSNPREAFMRVNAEGTRTLAKQAIAAGVKRFVFISSIGAMATISASLLTEGSPCNPTTDYGESKLLAEQYLIQTAQDSAMSWTILRPTLVYGPGNPGNMERLLKLINKQLPLPLGAIQNQRSFVYVENLISAIICTVWHPEAANEVFLVSDGVDISTPVLIEKLSVFLGKKAWLLPVPLKLMRGVGRLAGKAEAVERLAGSLAVDSHKIQRCLSWYPPYSLEQGLIATAQHFQAQAR